MWETSPRSAGAPSRLPYGSGAFSLEGVYMAHINSVILRLGVDVGSTTVKAVALDPADNSVLFTRYQRHNAHQADTVRQLLLDEIARGTSTYDGISIAWAMVEYLHNHPSARAKTLFATHYHELNEMERAFKRIKNYNVSVKEVGNKVIFLRKLIPGGSEHSFGIHVAKMAGMPKSIVKRSNEILKQLESENRQEGITGKPVKAIASAAEGYQLSFFQLDDPVLSQVRDEIKNLDVNNLTPLEALNKLSEIKRIITGK